MRNTCVGMITKSALMALLVGIVWLGAALPAKADPAPMDRDLLNPSAIAAKANHFPTRKLGRGISNVVFGVVEIPISMISVNREYGGAAGITWGTLRGVKRFVLREVVGVYEICTFFFRQGTIIEPEFPFMPEQRLEWRVQHPAED